MSWWAKPIGQKVGAALAGVSAIGAFGIHYLPQTVYLEKYKEIVQFYQNGFPLKLSPELRKTAETVLEQTSLTEAEKKSITFFHVCKQDPFYSGSTYTGYGALVGLPMSFNYETLEDVGSHKFAKLSGSKSIDWTSTAGRLLKESFVMSDDAKRFAIAEQVYLTNTRHTTMHSIAACGATLNIFILAKIFNLRLRGMPLLIRSVMYTFITIFCGTGYIAIKDLSNYANERESIERASNIGPEYRLGAVEYYEKCVVRNKAMRILLAEKGKKNFTAQGNKSTLVRTPHMPLSARLDFAKKLAKPPEECDVCNEISGTKPATAKP